MGDDRDLLMIIRRIMIRFMGIFAFPFEDSPSNTLLQGRLSNSERWMTALYKCNLSKIHDSRFLRCIHCRFYNTVLEFEEM